MEFDPTYLKKQKLISASFFRAFEKISEYFQETILSHALALVL